MAVCAIILSNVKDDADIIRNHHVSLKGYLKTGKELIMSNVFQFSNHAMSRLESRQISRYKVVKAFFGGQVFSSGKGLYKAKLWEYNGKMVDEYIVVFSKADITYGHGGKIYRQKRHRRGEYCGYRSYVAQYNRAKFLRYNSSGATEHFLYTKRQKVKYGNQGKRYHYRAKRYRFTHCISRKKQY